MNLVSFNQYAKHKDGTYVCLSLSQQSKDLLDNFVEMNLDLSERVDKSTYHITVIYSRAPVPSAENYLYMNSTLPVEATATGYEIFDNNCLVLRLECPYATRLNTELNAQGATSDYAEYKPHITLAYNISSDVDSNNLPLPIFELIFDKLIVEPLDPQFTPEISK